MNYVDTITRWRKLLLETRRKLRWDAIPRQVAESMAFEGEPVDLVWLHPTTHPLLAGSKPVEESSPILHSHH